MPSTQRHWMVVLLCASLGRHADAQGPTRFVLSNGLRVWVQEDHSRPVALVQITYKAGSLHETAGLTGVAHYVEHMVYRATQHVRNEDIYGYIDRIGGRYTGGTWPEMTRYAETVPGWALESALRVTADRMCCALFDSTEFERERGNILTEVNGYADVDPVSALHDAVMLTSFELHPYRYNSNTWARDNITLRRRDAYEWYKRHYGPNNAVLVIVGDVRGDSVKRLVTRYFAGIPRAPESGRIPETEPPQRAEKRVRLTYPGVRPRIEIVYRAPNAAHPDFPALKVLSRILVKRLSRTLSDTTVHVTVTDSASQYPYIYSVGATADSASALAPVVSALDGELRRLARGEVSPEELAAARTAHREPPTTSDTLSSGTVPLLPPRRSPLTRIADQLAARETEPWEVSDSLLKAIDERATAVTVADLQRYADRWLRPSQRTIGELVPGPDSFVPTWADGRPTRGLRVDVPRLTTPPAKRMTPEPVPARALVPLAPTGIGTARRELRNGVVIRSATMPGATRLFVRIGCECGGDTTLVAWARRLVLAAAPDADVRLARATRASRDASAEDMARTMALHAIDPAALYPANTGRVIVSVVGARPAGDLIAQIASQLSELPQVAPASRAPRAVDRTALRVTLDTAPQVDIVAALPGVPRGHPDRRALELLNYIVGVPSYGGRLGWALTKVGLTYAVAAATESGPANGHVLISTVANTHNVPAVEQAIREVVAGVGERGVEAWELREAQAFMLGRLLLYGARPDSPPDAIAAALEAAELDGIELLDPPAYSRAYLGVTLADLNRVAGAYYRADALVFALVGALGADERSAYAAGTFRNLFAP